MQLLNKSNIFLLNMLKEVTMSYEPVGCGTCLMCKVMQDSKEKKVCWRWREKPESDLKHAKQHIGDGND